MASWTDVLFLIIITPFFLGAIVGIFCAAYAVSLCFRSAKTALERRGVLLPYEGISRQADRRSDGDAYPDTTQRYLVKALGAAAVGPESHKHALSPSEDTREKHRFRRLGAVPRRSHGSGRAEY